jgi:trigger factor
LSKTKALSKTKEPLKVTQEKLLGSRVGLTIEISPEQSREAYEQTVTQFMRSAQIPGFRRGKVPRQVVMQQLGTLQIKAKTLEDLVESTFRDALVQEKIDALGNFQLVSDFEELLTQFEPGASITYVASIEVPPEATLKRYTDFKLKAEEVKYDPTQVDRVIDEQRSTRSTLVPVEGRAAEAGDVVQIDFSGQYFLGDDKTELTEIPGGSATDFQVELSEGQFIPGFIDGIVGMSPDETKEVELKFPDDYSQEDLAGKAAVFSITLKDIKTKELPEVNDEFVQEISEFKTVAELREFLEERYQKEAQDKTDFNVQAALLDALVEEIEVELPEVMVTNEVSFLINQMAQRLQSQGIDVNKLFNRDSIAGLKDRYRDEAVVRVRRTLALATVAQLESIELQSEEVEARFQELMGQFKNDRDIDRDRLREVIEEELLQQKVITWLKEHSEITLVEKLDPPEETTTPATAATVDVAATTVAAEETSAENSDAEQATETIAAEKKPRRSRTTKPKADSDSKKES